MDCAVLDGEDEEYAAGGWATPDDQYVEEVRQRFGFTW